MEVVDATEQPKEQSFSSDENENDEVGDAKVTTPARRNHNNNITPHKHNMSLASNSSNDSDSSLSHHHRGSSNTTAGSGSATRKRMSFTALPVVGNNHSPVKGGNSSDSPRRRTTVNSNQSSPTLVDQPIPSITTTATTHSRNRSGSNPMSSPTLSNSNDPSVLLGELAAKERKVVELKDEYKRIQQALKYAESDLKRFREKTRGVIEKEQEAYVAAHTPVYEQQQEEQQQESEEEKKNESIISEPTSTSVDIKPPTPPIPAAHKQQHQQQYTSNNTSSAPFSFNQHAFGRVASELNTHLWGLFEDIRNVAIGEDPREVPNYNTNNRHHQHSKDDQNSYYLV